MPVFISPTLARVQKYFALSGVVRNRRVANFLSHGSNRVKSWKPASTSSRSLTPAFHVLFTFCVESLQRRSRSFDKIVFFLVFFFFKPLQVNWVVDDLSEVSPSHFFEKNFISIKKLEILLYYIFLAEDLRYLTDDQ